LISDLLQLLLEIESMLLNLIDSPDGNIKIENIANNNGTGSGRQGAPFGEELSVEAIRIDMAHVRDEWRYLRPNVSPQCVVDVVEMMKQFCEKSVWQLKLKIPNVLKLVAIMTVNAATSAFVERTFPLANCVCTYLVDHK